MLCKRAFLEEDDEDQTLDDMTYVHKAMNHTFKLGDLDLRAISRELSTSTNYEPMLKFIVSEIKHPFKDMRIKKIRLSDEDLFYMLSQEHKEYFVMHRLVDITVLKIYKSNITCKIDESNVHGVVYKKDIFDKPDLVEDIASYLGEGQSVKARIKKIDCPSFRVELTLRPTEINTQRQHLTSLYPSLIENENTFKIGKMNKSPLGIFFY
jgi:transcriptional accessory protein Tex/SPT6